MFYEHRKAVLLLLFVTWACSYITLIFQLKAAIHLLGLSDVSDSKESAYNAGDLVWSLGQKVPLEKGTGTHSSILAWRIPWTEEHGGPQSMALQRVRQAWLIYTYIHFLPTATKIKVSKSRTIILYLSTAILVLLPLILCFLKLCYWVYTHLNLLNIFVEWIYLLLNHISFIPSILFQSILKW